MQKKMMFSGDENHRITLADVNVLTQNFRENYSHKGILGGYINTTALQEIVTQKDAVGVRYYYAIDESGTAVLIFVGANASGQDLLNGKLAVSAAPYFQTDILRQPVPQDKIGLDRASALTRNYRKANRQSFIKGAFFGKNAIQQLVGHEGMLGIRYFYGLETDSKRVLILTGVSHTGEDMVEQILFERGIPCPPYCADFNPLNSYAKVHGQAVLSQTW